MVYNIKVKFEKHIDVRSIGSSFVYIFVGKDSNSVLQGKKKENCSHI